MADRSESVETRGRICGAEERENDLGWEEDRWSDATVSRDGLAPTDSIKAATSERMGCSQ